MSPPKVDLSSKKNLCCKCNNNNIFSIDMKKCIACLKEMICAKCQKTTSEYNYKYQFNYATEYCEIMCKAWEIYSQISGLTYIYEAKRGQPGQDRENRTWREQGTGREQERGIYTKARTGRTG
jgi:hypothetical protein